MPTVAQSADGLKRDKLRMTCMEPNSLRYSYRGGNCDFGAGAARLAVGAFAV